MYKKIILVLMALCMIIPNVSAAPTLTKNEITASIGYTDKNNKVQVTNIRANLEHSDPSWDIILEDNLQVGSEVYSNDHYSTRAESYHKDIKDAAGFEGLQYLRMDDNNWWYLEMSDKFLQFDIDRPATVYVAYKKRLSSLDQIFKETHWLMDPKGGWKYTGKDITINTGKTPGVPTGEDTYSVFMKTFNPGTVYLPGNNAPGLKISVSNQYLVFIGNAISQPKDNYISPNSVVPGKIPAFPGAEGGGMYATGGRGGEVYEVTNLLDYGKDETPIPGSLRDAVSKPNRTVVFRVSGTIELKSTLNITEDNITIAGQTSPGGICVKNWPLSIGGNNKIIRFIKSRPGDVVQADFDGIGFSFGRLAILDHISASWSVDECASFRYVTDFTLQYSAVGESNLHATYMTSAHGFGGIWGGNNATYHHNLMIHNISRMPRFNSGPMDFRNNVIYDWGYKAQYGDSVYSNFVANYYKPGKSTTQIRFAEPSAVSATRDKGMYINGNIMYGNEDMTNNNLLGVLIEEGKDYMMAEKEVIFPNPVKTQTAQAAFDTVMKYAGSSPNPENRDAVDKRFIQETIDGTGSLRYTSIPDPSRFTQAQCDDINSKIKEHNAEQVVYEWPELTGPEPPVDTDHDGMPDEWELEHGLNPEAPEDRNGDFTGDGYTNLEKYLNELAEPAMPKDEDYEGCMYVPDRVQIETLPYYKEVDDTYKVVVNGSKTKFFSAPININDSLYVPMKDIYFEASYAIEEKEDGSLRAYYQTEQIKMNIGSDKATIGDKEVVMNGAPFKNDDGVTYVPLRFVAESINGKIEWDSDTNTAYITTDDYKGYTTDVRPGE